jgi:hypothetical protein
MQLWVVELFFGWALNGKGHFIDLASNKGQKTWGEASEAGGFIAGEKAIVSSIPYHSRTGIVAHIPENSLMLERSGVMEVVTMMVVDVVVMVWIGSFVVVDVVVMVRMGMGSFVGIMVLLTGL